MHGGGSGCKMNAAAGTDHMAHKWVSFMEATNEEFTLMKNAE